MKKLIPANSDRLEQEAVAWLVRLTSGEASPDEFAEFAKWQARSPAHNLAYRKLSALWDNLENPLLEQHQQEQGELTEGERQLPTIDHSLKPDLNSGTQKKWLCPLSIFTVVLVIFTAGLFPDYLQHPLAEYRTNIGERTTVKLSDGSVIHLNTASAINTAYTNRERTVELLLGEAEFEVAHDAQRPFIVTSGTIKTQAIGTKFLVRYQAEAGSVTLLEGKVKVFANSGLINHTNAVTLSQSKQISFKNDRISLPKQLNIAGVDEWKNGRLFMNFVTLEQAVTEINRYRRGKVAIMDKALAQREINAAIDIKQIDAWLDALQETLPVHVYRAGPIVIINAVS